MTCTTGATNGPDRALNTFKRSCCSLHRHGRARKPFARFHRAGDVIPHRGQGAAAFNIVAGRIGQPIAHLVHRGQSGQVIGGGLCSTGVEINGTIADDINRSVIQEQVEMGVAVRMAAMDLLARNLRQRTQAVYA